MRRADRERAPNEVQTSVRWVASERATAEPSGFMQLVQPAGAPGATSQPPPSTGGLGRATALMAGGTLLARATGLVRLLVAAYALGYSQFSDAFNLANNTPNIVHDLVLGGILSATFVPLFVDRLATRNEREASEAISAVITMAAVVLGIATVLFVLASPLFIDLYSLGTTTHHIGAERSVATELLRIFAIQLLGYGAVSLMTALLNSVRRFALPAYVPILNNLVSIGILIEFHLAERHPSLGGVEHHSSLILLLGFGTTAGVLVQALALVPSVLSSGLRLRPRFSPRHEAVREVLSLSGWTAGFVLLNQLAMFVTLALAVHIGGSAGVATAYTYAFIFFQLPFGMVAVSVMSTVTPELSQRWSTEDLTGMAHQFGVGIRRMLAGILPATAGYLVLAGPIMALLLRHGAAGSHGPTITAELLAMLALGLPGYCTYLLAIRALQSMRDTRSAFFLYLLENGLNVLLVFVLTTAIGPRGLGLSLAVSYSVAAVVALGVVRRKMGGLGGRRVGTYVSRSLALSVAMAVCVAAVAAGIGSASGIGLLEKVVVSVLAGVAVYAGGAVLASNLGAWQTAVRRRRAPGGGA